MSPAVSSTRWCPTPEQLMILEEMYRSGGIRTPNASQIQQITAHLSYYGRIEGKNVFYWFQNHKARDRQKLRRKLSKQLHHHNHHHQQQPPQQQQNQQNLHHHLLYYLDQSHTASSPTPPPPQLSNSTPTTFLPQGGFHHEDNNNNASTKVMNYTWKVDIAPAEMEKQSMMRMYGRDWTMMMMMDVGPMSPRQNRPLKTLELFPITATNLKDECNNNTSPNNNKKPFLHASLSLSPPS